MAATLEAQTALCAAKRGRLFASFGESLPYKASVPAHDPVLGGGGSGAGAEDDKEPARTLMLAHIGRVHKLVPLEDILVDFAVTQNCLLGHD